MGIKAKTYDAIIIGSGIGGLAAALMLAHQGKKTVVLEKGSSPGGRLASFEKDGFCCLPIRNWPQTRGETCFSI